MCDCSDFLAGSGDINSSISPVHIDANTTSPVSRRSFIAAGAGFALTSLLPVSDAFSSSRGMLALNIKNQTTGEALKVAWLQNGKIDKKAILALHMLTRDWREKRAAKMDVKLYLILSYIQHSVGLDNQIVLTSGYRTVETNNKLLPQGASPNSYHIRGQALDFTVQGVNVATTRDLAAKLNLGGVGYYPNNNYVHIDTGPVRSWQS